MWEVAGLLLQWMIALLWELVCLVARCVLLIVRVIALYGWAPLRTSLLIFAGFAVVSVLLFLLHVPALGVIGGAVGFAQLSIRAKVLEVTNSDVFLKTPDLPVKQILQRDWFD